MKTNRFVIRSMVEDDLYRGFLEVLNCLRPTLLLPDAAREVFAFRSTNYSMITVVATDTTKGGQVVGTATVIFDKKFLHGGSYAAQIEDVAVLADYQGQGVGALLVNYCVDFARRSQAYKVSLTCSDEVLPFYEKLGFSKKDNALRMNL